MFTLVSLFSALETFILWCCCNCILGYVSTKWFSSFFRPGHSSAPLEWRTNHQNASPEHWVCRKSIFIWNEETTVHLCPILILSHTWSRTMATSLALLAQYKADPCSGSGEPQSQGWIQRKQLCECKTRSVFHSVLYIQYYPTEGLGEGEKGIFDSHWPPN